MPDELIKWLHIFYGYFHDLAIAVYIGGAVAMEFVLGPAQNAIPPAQAQVMGQKTADRFLWLVWGSLTLIVVTGVLRLQRMGLIVGEWPPFKSPLEWSDSYGRTVIGLLVIWVVLLINGVLITFVLRPRLTGKMSAGTSASQVTARQGARLQAARWIMYLTRADLGLALVAALFGASLKWGGIL